MDLEADVLINFVTFFPFIQVRSILGLADLLVTMATNLAKMRRSLRMVLF